MSTTGKAPLDIIAENLPWPSSGSPAQRAKQAAAIMAALAQDGFEITRDNLPWPTERERIVQLLISADLAATFTYHFPRQYLEHLADAIIKGRAN
jgi:hypothetical protein